MKATEMSMRFNIRQRRADSLTHAVLQKIWPRLDATDPDELHHHIRRIVYDAISEVMIEHGVEVVTDRDREEMGLPPRGPDGWTIEEMMALERRRLELLTAPLTAFIPARTFSAQIDEHQPAPDENETGAIG